MQPLHHLPVAVALAMSLAACAAPTTAAGPTTPAAAAAPITPVASPAATRAKPKTRINSPHVYAHEHILELDSTDLISSKLWAQYNRQIAKLMGNETDPSLQILTTALAVSPTATDDGLDIQTQLEIFAGNIPEWSPAYATSTHKVLDAYRAVLDQIKPGADASVTLQAEFDKRKAEATKAATDINDFRKERVTDWKDLNDFYVQNEIPKVTWNEYMEDFAAELKVLQAENTLKTDKLAEVVGAQAAVSSSYLDALLKLKEELNAVRLAPQYTFSPNIADMVGQWTSTGAYQGKPAGGLAQSTFQFSNTSQSTDYSKTSWSVGGGYSSWTGWFHARGSASGSNESLITSSSTYDMAIRFASTARVIATAKNLNTVLLKEYENGPWVDGSMLATNKTTAWGQNGLFPMMTTELLIVYNPSVTMKLDQNTYKYAKSTLTTHVDGSYGWGPFGGYSGGGDTSSTHVKTSYDDASASITIADTSNIPKIVAVRNHLMP